MPQVLVQVTPDAFYYAFNHNARRRDQIRVSPILSEQVTLRCAQEFHRLNPSKWYGVPVPPNRKLHQAKLDRFHKLHCHVRVAMEGNDKRGGFIVLSGELLGLHHVDPGHGDWLMQHAVSLGADRLDCYDIPHLIELYKRHGFREVLREANHTAGQPDVVWMRKSNTMSRKVDPKTVQVGDRVRVGRESDAGGPLHGIKFGAVCLVHGIEGGDILVSGPMHDADWCFRQWVAISSCKVAK